MSKYKDTKTIRVEYHGPEVEWNLDEELEDFNDELQEGQTPYTKDDIEDIWVKWNRLHVEFADGREMECGGFLEQDIDTKRPNEFRGFSSDGERTIGPDYDREGDLKRALRLIVKILAEECENLIEFGDVDSFGYDRVMESIKEARKVLDDE